MSFKTQLHEAAVRKAEVSIPIYKILKNRNIQFHLGEVKNIDVQNKTVQIDDKLLPFLFLVIAIGSKVELQLKIFMPRYLVDQRKSTIPKF